MYLIRNTISFRLQLHSTPEPLDLRIIVKIVVTAQFELRVAYRYNAPVTSSP